MKFKTDKTSFTFDTEVVKYENCKFSVGKYENGNMSVAVISDIDGYVFTISTNSIGVKLEPYQLAIKDFGENTGVFSAMKKAGFIKDIIKKVDSSFLSINIVTLTDKFFTFSENFGE